MTEVRYALITQATAAPEPLDTEQRRPQGGAGPGGDGDDAEGGRDRGGERVQRGWRRDPDPCDNPSLQ